jgi:hypothetical protein
MFPLVPFLVMLAVALIVTSVLLPPRRPVMVGDRVRIKGANVVGHVTEENGIVLAVMVGGKRWLISRDRAKLLRA